MGRETSQETLQYHSPVETFPSGKHVTKTIGRLIHLQDDASGRSLLKLPVQATGSDGFKLALISISEKLNGPNARIVHTRHDEMTVEAGDAMAA